MHGAGAVGSSSHPAPFQSLTQPCAFSPYGSPCVVVIVSQVHMRNNLAGKAKQRTGERALLSEDGGDRRAQRSSLPCPPGVSWAPLLDVPRALVFHSCHTRLCFPSLPPARAADGGSRHPVTQQRELSFLLVSPLGMISHGDTESKERGFPFFEERPFTSADKVMCKTMFGKTSRGLVWALQRNPLHSTPDGKIR